MAQVSSQTLLHLHPAFRHAAGRACGGGVSREHLHGGALRIFEPNFGELLVPYSELATFWNDLRGEYRGLSHQGRCGWRQVLTEIAVHGLQ